MRKSLRYQIKLNHEFWLELDDKNEATAAFHQTITDNPTSHVAIFDTAVLPNKCMTAYNP